MWIYCRLVQWLDETVVWVLKQAPLKSHRRAFPKGATIWCPLRFEVTHRSDSRTGFSTSWSLKTVEKEREPSTCLALQHHLLMRSNPADSDLFWTGKVCLFCPHLQTKETNSHFNWKVLYYRCSIDHDTISIQSVFVECWKLFSSIMSAKWLLCQINNVFLECRGHLMCQSCIFWDILLHV